MPVESEPPFCNPSKPSLLDPHVSSANHPVRKDTEKFPSSKLVDWMQQESKIVLTNLQWRNVPCLGADKSHTCFSHLPGDIILKLASQLPPPIPIMTTDSSFGSWDSSLMLNVEVG
ncbi:hypothetical protein Bbelb_392640 [Branchiostoma belcheri]|nr:hypothetical protein Bbelb_392640 [Branchiostoma belcheri]